jgi:erythronate-4-phosphate dehydrogenase
VKAALREHRISGAILDVWEGEPEIDYSLLERVDIGTPHIAGVALDGKVRATEMAREELSRFWGIPSSGLSDSVYPPNRRIQPREGTRGLEAATSVLLQGFDILKKDAELRALGTAAADQAAAGFDRLRNATPLRLEFRHFTVDLGTGYPDLAGTFRNLGFEVLGD